MTILNDTFLYLIELLLSMIFCSLSKMKFPWQYYTVCCKSDTILYVCW